LLYNFPYPNKDIEYKRESMNIFLIAGARPNFMKIAPIYRETQNFDDLTVKIVHTGQHYDYEMSQAFFDDLELPEPDYFLNAGSGSHAVQTSNIMLAFEKLVKKDPPDLVIVVGDVNSTLACSIVAKKECIRVAHVEAGLRSFDLAMPEEINRMVTDAISDLFFVTEKSALENLLGEGKAESQVYFVGHVMIDNLLYQAKKLDSGEGQQFGVHELKSKLGEYNFLTLHRPSNVDDEKIFRNIVTVLNQIAAETPIIFPVHPRTQKMIKAHGIKLSDNIHCLKPLSFNESLYLWKDAKAVLTDSGGLQEETTAMGIPCVTIRDNTERPITVERGTNLLGGTRKETILAAYGKAIMRRKQKERSVPPKWDGRASERILRIIRGYDESLKH
jgi:UDP-N-acetylglucosamine 2-epimerase (non-hydrolysing)